MKLLVETGANLEARDDGGRTALFYAASHKYINIVKLLIASGAKQDVIDYKGKKLKRIIKKMNIDNQ